jgi:hypothetical protein
MPTRIILVARIGRRIGICFMLRIDKENKMNENNALVKYFEGQPVNIYMDNETPWFKAKDVAERLGT